MKILFFILLLTACSNSHANGLPQPVNFVTGDISFVNKYGVVPGNAGEMQRIQTHLEYVEQVLRDKDVSEMTPELRANRNQAIEFLKAYRMAAKFPKNYDHPETRIPCFIDKDGNICAVGYLVEMTSGREVAEKINSKYKYELIENMNDELVDEWIANSGLTKEECAMIQPAYGPAPGDYSQTISPAYGISSASLGGVNLALNAVNGIQLLKGSGSKAFAFAGLITGAGQTVLGITMFPKEPKESLIIMPQHSESRKNLSMMNIALGSTTMILSAINLLSKKEPRNRKLKIELGSMEIPYSQPATCISLVRRL